MGLSENRLPVASSLVSSLIRQTHQNISNRFFFLMGSLFYIPFMIINNHHKPMGLIMVYLSVDPVADRPRGSSRSSESSEILWWRLQTGEDWETRRILIARIKHEKNLHDSIVIWFLFGMQKLNFPVSWSDFKNATWIIAEAWLRCGSTEASGMPKIRLPRRWTKLLLLRFRCQAHSRRLWSQLLGWADRNGTGGCGNGVNKSTDSICFFFKCFFIRIRSVNIP